MVEEYKSETKNRSAMNNNVCCIKQLFLFCRFLRPCILHSMIDVVASRQMLSLLPLARSFCFPLIPKELKKVTISHTYRYKYIYKSLQYMYTSVYLYIGIQ